MINLRKFSYLLLSSIIFYSCHTSPNVAEPPEPIIQKSLPLQFFEEQQKQILAKAKFPVNSKSISLKTTSTQSFIGFNYHQPGVPNTETGSFMFTTRNYSEYLNGRRPVIVADLDHLASLSVKIIRILLQAKATGFTNATSQGVI